ncbi:MAG TPA: AAA family ATPase [Solirubrobacterales bacterium]
MRFFSIDRIKTAIEHLQEYDSKWVLVPLVFAANGVGDEEPVRVQGAGKAGTESFFAEYFSGEAIGLPAFDNGANTLRPRFSEIKANLAGPGDYVVHQRQKLWGSQYSRNGYIIMKHRGLVIDHKSSTWQIAPSFWPAWQEELPSSFRFEELLVWLFSFSGIPDEVEDWEGLSTAFQDWTLGTGVRFPTGYEARFRISGDVPWPGDLLDERPSNEEFQEALMPSLKRVTHDSVWLKERFDEWSKDREFPDDDEKHNLEMQVEFASLLSEESLASPEDFDLDLFRKLLADHYGHPGNQANLNRYLKEEGEAGIARLTKTISYVLYGDGDEAERLDAVTDADSELRVFGLGEAILTKCLAIALPERWLPLFMFGSSAGKGKEDILELLEAGLDNANSLSMGEKMVRSNDALRERTEPLAPEEPWVQASFLWWLRTYGSDAASLASELHLDQRWFSEVGELLEDKRQVIFYGPPGTGKTFVAQRFAEWYADDCVETVQFHPSYTYEDFVQGFRPVAGKDGGVEFTLVPGPLLDLAKTAKETGKQCVMLIDEINRGNLAKVFGELYYLLEYRDEDIRLQYGDEFRLPENLVLIGTMNTADRSIAFIDAALRRRFHFVPFFPDAWPVKGLLGRWLQANKPGMTHVADLLDAANKLLDERDFQIGPAHFMTDKLDDEWLEMIWKYSVIPYLEEHFFDEPERVGDFDLERLLAKIQDDGTGTDATPEAVPAEGVGAD